MEVAVGEQEGKTLPKMPLSLKWACLSLAKLGVGMTVNERDEQDG